MNEMDKRQETMQRDVSMVAIAALSLVNGMHFSPWFDPVAILLRPFLAGTFFGTPLVSLYITSFFISAMTLLIAGVPAALYERFRGGSETSPTSLYIWLVATILFTAHALLAAAGGR
jgi:hypothetical protein